MNQTNAVDFAAPIFIYNRQGMSDVLYKVSTILYLDDDTCLAVAKILPPLFKDYNFLSESNQRDIKILFNPETSDVLTSEHIHYLGITQDLTYAASRTGNPKYYLKD